MPPPLDSRERRAISALVGRLAGGDRDAFTPAFERLWPIVHGFAQRVLAGHVDADDVAQRALLSIFARASEYDPSRDAVAWALGITGWECRTHRRKVLRRRESGLRGVERPTPSPEDLLVDADLQRAFDALVGTLSSDDRVALGLDRGLDRDCVGPLPATLRKRKQRLLLRLRAAWSRTDGSRP